MARIRVSRVGEQIKKELSFLIQRELKDPRIGFVTITAVELSGDLQIAKVYVSILGDGTQRADSLLALDKAKGHLRFELGQRMKLRHIPEISFQIDTSLDHSEHISKLLKDVKQPDKMEESKDD